jgi:hypothetical protein
VLAPRQFGWSVMGTVLEPDLGQRFAGKERQTLVDQRQFNVFQRTGARQQIIALKHEPQIVTPQQGPLVARQSRNTNPLEQVLSAGRGIQIADHVHGRRFTRSDGAHDHHELATADAQVDAVKRAHNGVALPVDAADASQPDQRRRRVFHRTDP